jgi:hypothetical protein
MCRRAKLARYVQVAGASCTFVVSPRKGCGIVVAKSVAAGTLVVANNPEKPATSLVSPGVDAVVADVFIQAMTQGIANVIDSGASLRRTATEWRANNS